MMLQLYEYEGTKYFGQKTESSKVFLYLWNGDSTLVPKEDVKTCERRVQEEIVKRMIKWTTVHKTTFYDLCKKWIDSNQSSRKIATLLDASNSTTLTILDSFGLKGRLIDQTARKRSLGKFC